MTKNKKVRRKHNHLFLQAIMLMVACGISTGIGACSKTAENPRKPEPAKPAVAAPTEKKAAGADIKKSAPSPSDEQKTGADFTYDPTGKPDPFAPLVTEMPASKQLPTAALPESELTPLQKYDLSELILVAIILQNNVEPTAMVEDKAGYGYILKKGMLIGKNNGIIKEITTNDVVIDESTVDAAGVKKSKTITLTITKNMLGEK